MRKNLLLPTKSAENAGVSAPVTVTSNSNLNDDDGEHFGPQVKKTNKQLQQRLLVVPSVLLPLLKVGSQVPSGGERPGHVIMLLLFQSWVGLLLPLRFRH